MLKNKLIPELWKYVDMARDELVYGWELELPAADDGMWTILKYASSVVNVQLTICRMGRSQPRVCNAQTRGSYHSRCIHGPPSLSGSGMAQDLDRLLD